MPILPVHRIQQRSVMGSFDRAAGIRGSVDKQTARLGALQFVTGNYMIAVRKSLDAIDYNIK